VNVSDVHLLITPPHLQANLEALTCFAATFSKNPKWYWAVPVVIRRCFSWGTNDSSLRSVGYSAWNLQATGFAVKFINSYKMWKQIGAGANGFRISQQRENPFFWSASEHVVIKLFFCKKASNVNKHIAALIKSIFCKWGSFRKLWEQTHTISRNIFFSS